MIPSIIRHSSQQGGKNTKCSGASKLRHWENICGAPNTAYQPNGTQLVHPHNLRLANPRHGNSAYLAAKAPSRSSYCPPNQIALTCSLTRSRYSHPHQETLNFELPSIVKTKCTIRYVPPNWYISIARTATKSHTSAKMFFDPALSPQRQTPCSDTVVANGSWRGAWP